MAVNQERAHASVALGSAKATLLRASLGIGVAIVIDFFGSQSAGEFWHASVPDAALGAVAGTIFGLFRQFASRGQLQMAVAIGVSVFIAMVAFMLPKAHGIGDIWPGLLLSGGVSVAVGGLVAWAAYELPQD